MSTFTMAKLAFSSKTIFELGIPKSRLPLACMFGLVFVWSNPVGLQLQYAVAATDYTV